MGVIFGSVAFGFILLALKVIEFELRTRDINFQSPHFEETRLTQAELGFARGAAPGAIKSRPGRCIHKSFRSRRSFISSHDDAVIVGCWVGHSGSGQRGAVCLECIAGARSWPVQPPALKHLDVHPHDVLRRSGSLLAADPLVPQAISCPAFPSFTSGRCASGVYRVLKTSWYRYAQLCITPRSKSAEPK